MIQYSFYCKIVINNDSNSLLLKGSDKDCIVVCFKNIDNNKSF